MEKKTVTLKDIRETVAEQVSSSTKGIMERLDSIEKGVNQVNKPEDADMVKYQARIISAQITAMREEAQGGGKHAEGRAGRVKDLITERYAKKDPAFVTDFTARYKDLMATGNGGELIVEEYSAGFLDQLWDATIVDKLGVRFLPSPSGNLRISKIVEGISAGYVGEGGTIETSTIKLGSIKLSVKKAMALVPISNDLIRYSSANAEAMVIDQITNEFAQLVDKSFLYGKGGEFEPTGLFSTKEIQEITTPTAPSYALGLTMKSMIGKANLPSKDGEFVMGWGTYLALQLEKNESGTLINKAEMDAGKFAGLPYHVSNKIDEVAGNEDLLLVVPSEITAIQGLGLTIAQSNSASIPTKDGNLDAFAQDFTIVRAMIEHDFKLNYGKAAVKAKAKLK